MNNVISVLEKMASDSAFNNMDIANSVFAINKLSEEEKNCFLNNDSLSLSIISKDLPTIKCFAILPAEDDDSNEDSNEDSNDDSTKNYLTANNNLPVAING